MTHLYRCLRTSVALAIVVLVIASPFSTLRASNPGNDIDWPKWRGQNHDGKVVADGVLNFDKGQGLKVAWKKPLGSGYSSISIADNKAVTMFSDSTYDYVIAFDAMSGNELWRFKIDSSYIGHNGSHNGQISTPTLDGDKIFVMARKGQLLALNSDDGKKLWEHNIKDEYNSLEPFHGFGTSPLVVGNSLVVQISGTDNRAVAAFDKNSGQLLWATQSDTTNYQSPISLNLAGENQLVCVGDKEIMGLNPETGQTLWGYRHNGRWGSVYPVFVAPDKLFLNHSFRESMLLQVTKENGKYNAQELWKTRDIKQTYNTSVYHEGYIYGYSGRFITCVDAETGKSVWKSRPPGDGFLILVDGHLVVQTRQGTMHVAKASPEGYQEVASLEVYDGLSWTPPSFAYGRIYTRNLYEIAALEVGDVDQVFVEADTEPQMVAPKSKFAAWVKKVEMAENKKALIDEFMNSQKNFPVIEDKKYAHIVYRGEVKDLALAGDMLQTGVELPMNRIEGTDFYYASFELPADTRLNYRFTRNFEERIPDPLNKHIVPDAQGEMSQLAMPDWAQPKHFEEPTGKAGGRLDSLAFESKILNNTRTVQVYLPAGYEDGQNRYPTVYVNYGQPAIQLGLMPNSLDNLIGKTVAPLIAVFIDAPNSFPEYARDQRDQFAQMIAEELVPYIDKNYRTLATRESRLFMGGDEGGYAAINTAFQYPALFGNLAGQSTHLFPSAGGDELVAMVKETEKQPFTFYLDWGKYDLDYPNSSKWAELNTFFMKLLKEKGYSVTGGQVNEGFGWASWRNRTDKILETFFPLQKTQK